MAKNFNFEVVTPDRLFFSEEVEAIAFSTPEGEMGVLAEHAPMLIAVKPCILKIMQNEKEEIDVIDEDDDNDQILEECECEEKEVCVNNFDNNLHFDISYHEF